MTVRTLSVICLLVLAVTVSCDENAGVSITDLFNKLSSAPSLLTERAGSVNASSLSGIFNQMQDQINQTLVRLGQSPEVEKLVQQVKAGVQNLQDTVAQRGSELQSSLTAGKK